MITKSLPWILLVVCLMAWAVDHYRLQKSLDDVSKLDAYLAERERESAALLQLPHEARSEYFQMKIKEAEAEISKSTIHTTLYEFGDKQVPWEELPKEVQEEFRKALLPPETGPSTPPETNPLK